MKTITLFTYPNLTTPVGKRLDLTWEEIARRCTVPTRRDHTMAQYRSMDNATRRKVKEAPAFLGARSTDGRRRKDSIEAYTLICLDMDSCPVNAPADLCGELTAMGVQAVLYSTHSSTPFSPRLRLIINPSRELTAREYPKVCRAIADRLTHACGADRQQEAMFDPSAWAGAHIFFWPTCPSDAVFVGERVDGEPLDVDALLGQEQPAGSRPRPAEDSRSGRIRTCRERQGTSPQEVFDRVFTVTEAIDRFLPDIYRFNGAANRYDYLPGEGVAGLVILDERTAFSHHGSDPAAGHPLSPYMIVGIHRHGMGFGRGKARQRAAMDRWVMTLPEVRQAMLHARGMRPGEEWLLDMETDTRDRYLSTRSNVRLILGGDPAVAGAFYLDTFAHRLMYRPDRLFGGEKRGDNGAGAGSDRPRPWGDAEDARLRCWLEKEYGITGRDLIADAMVVAAGNVPVHPVREYLDSLHWDGTPRLDRVLVDILGAADNELNRYMTRMFFVAAVARVMEPGCKFDYCPVLRGRQGIGKSMVLSIMGGEWFTDALIDLRDKDGLMVLQGRWIVEMGELKALKKAEDYDAKAFLTVLEDRFRPPYGRNMVDYPRQCVFAATTNEEFFLKSSEGNRRFVPIECHGTTAYSSVPEALEALRGMRDQLWAEAVAVWRDGMELWLPDYLETQARERQTQVNEDRDDPLRDAIDQFISTPQPADWYKYSVASRMSWYRHPHDDRSLAGCRLPKRVSVHEVLQEVLGARPSDRDYYLKARKLGKYLNELPGWRHIGTSRHTYGLYRNTVKAWEKGDDAY